MLKGVNRQAIEISRTENEYFERIIFFVRPEYAGEKESKLYKEAQAVTRKENEQPTKSRYNQHNKLKNVLLAVLSAGLGAGITATLMWLF